MASPNSDSTLKRLIHTNIKTQESMNTVVKMIKELVSTIKEAGTEETEEIKAIEATGDKSVLQKLDLLMQQNSQLIRAMNELTQSLRRHTGEPPSGPGTLAPPPQPPPEWRRL